MTEGGLATFFSRLVEGGSATALAVAFLVAAVGGLVTSLGPCNLAMIPVLVAYVTGARGSTAKGGALMAIAFVVGNSLTFAALGVVVALLGGLFGRARFVLNYLTAAVVIIVGLHLLGLIRLHLPQLGGIRPDGRRRPPGLVGALALGLTVGWAGSQCATPVLLAVLSLVMAKGRLLLGAALLFVYGLGRGAPLIAAGSFTGFVKAAPVLSRWTTWLEKAAGIVLLGFGLYYIWTA